MDASRRADKTPHVRRGRGPIENKGEHTFGFSYLLTIRKEEEPGSDDCAVVTLLLICLQIAFSVG